jgi:tellurite resistance protein TerB
MNFNSVKDWLNQQQTSLKDSVTRFKNKDFMDAVVAGCAMVAAADGSISSYEKQKMAGFINRTDELKVFEMKTVIERFNHFVEGFEFDNIIGKGEALKAIIKVKGNEEAARLLVRVCCAIGMADGAFDDNEKKIVSEICQELNLNANDFGL